MLENIPKKYATRREFIEQGILGTMSFLLPKIKKDSKSTSIEMKEEIEVVERSKWDNAWEDASDSSIGLKHRYENEVGDRYLFRLKGIESVDEKLRTRIVTTFSYLENSSTEIESLEKFYKRIIVHHTEMDEEGLVGDDEVEQMRFLRSAQILSDFGDLAYHFAITSSGKIFEGVPFSHIGGHAGNTKETVESLKSNIADTLSSIRNEKNLEKKKEKIELYKNSLKKDPDYGSLGVVLLGNFDKKDPTKEQLDSLRNILDYFKCAFHIPKDNIILHSEVGEKVVEASGYHLSSGKKDCPGKNFPSLEEIKKDLLDDTPEAQSKSILLE